VHRSALDRGHELAAGQNAEAFRTWRAGLSAADLADADAAWRLQEFADLDTEEAHCPGPRGFLPPRIHDLPPEQRDHRTVIRFLPPELAPFLVRMSPARRREREQAILAYVGWEGLELLGRGPMALAEEAADRARRYAVKFPRQDHEGNPTHQEPAHRKGRCEKWQRRRLVKAQTRALLYVEQALGAVGGPVVPGRPLYVSDYALTLHREQARRTVEILEGLRLVQVEDPTIQIPMAELNQRAKVADVTKRRLLMDALLRRFAGLGWHVCWITITLPGRYVANATNEGRRAEGWDARLGPQEALDALQDMHHQTMALLRERQVRPCGWWNAQPQQSGTPHRHIILACPTQEDARAVCDAFWGRFSSTPIEERQEERRRADPGCSAYVIGDADVRYAPPRGANGKAETAASVARYAARYATRYDATRRSSKAGELPADAVDTGQPQTGDEQERFAAWKTRRRVRGHTWIGFDSRRSPMETWDTLWANAMRSEDMPDDPRMALAIRLMRETQAHAENAAELRREATDIQFSDERDEVQAAAGEAADRAAFLAWHAGIAMGLWADTDLDPAEQDWLRDEIEESDPLPPMPLRVTKVSGYGEERRAVIGCFSPSTGEVLLRTEKEWKIVDTATAAQMVAEAGAGRIAAPVVGQAAPPPSEAVGLDHLSDSPTDPRVRGCAPPSGGEPGDKAPPGGD